MAKSKPTEEATVPCGHAVKLKYWFDHAEQTWRAKLTFTEQRCGKQYGGAVVSEFAARKGTEYKAFMALVRQKAGEQIRLFWT
jgi:hypothetical protein